MNMYKLPRGAFNRKNEKQIAEDDIIDKLIGKKQKEIDEELENQLNTSVQNLIDQKIRGEGIFICKECEEKNLERSEVKK